MPVGSLARSCSFSRGSTPASVNLQRDLSWLCVDAMDVEVGLRDTAAKCGIPSDRRDNLPAQYRRSENQSVDCKAIDDQGNRQM